MNYYIYYSISSITYAQKMNCRAMRWTEF